MWWQAGRRASVTDVSETWMTDDPARMMGRGHTAGDFLEAWKWTVEQAAEGFLRVSAHLPERALNPAGQLFGGFTPTYVDLVSIFTVIGPGASRGVRWLSTVSMSLDYFEPITGPTFVIEGREEKRRGRNHHVITRFFQDDELAVIAATTLRDVTG